MLVKADFLCNNTLKRRRLMFRTYKETALLIQKEESKLHNPHFESVSSDCINLSMLPKTELLSSQ